MADEPKNHDKGEGNEPAKSLEDFVTEHYNKQKVESLFTHTFPTIFFGIDIRFQIKKTGKTTFRSSVLT